MVKYDSASQSGWRQDWEFPIPEEDDDMIDNIPLRKPHTHIININDLKLTFHDGSRTHMTYKITSNPNGSLKLTMTNDYNEWGIDYGREEDGTLWIERPVYLDFSSSSNIDLSLIHI